MIEAAVRYAVRAAVLAAALAPAAAAAEEAGARWPMFYLWSAGTRGGETLPLLWGLLILSVAVVIVISSLVVIATVRGRRRPLPEAGSRGDISRAPGGLPWIYGGLIATTVVLAVFTVWTVATMASISEPSEEPAYTIDIVGHQWWWEVTYRGEEPYETFETANEIHVPVGLPVRIRLSSADVIHSFWIPALSGKTDAIPGNTNVTWIKAEEPGVYRGQCTEYCGPQHAHMSMLLVAQEVGEFEEWRRGQIALQDPPETEAARLGQRQFYANCAACHTVRGTLAGGDLGPDLTHLMSRSTIAANMLPNNIGHLSGWVADPQGIKPHALMPNLDLSGPQLAALRNYLLTLE